MRWDEVRENYRSQWVIIEAINARTEGSKRIIEQLTVVDTFQDSKEALLKYVQLHKLHPKRELYVVHTSRLKLDIEEQRWIGVRAQ